MNTNRLTLENTLYLLAFAIALAVRLYRLGAAPLSDFEADWALQALGVSRWEQVAFGNSPGYVTLTGLTFFVVGSSNFAARLWPALAGSLLVLVPFIFRQPLGRKAALVLAFGLALDPGLVSISRMAGGEMLAAGWGLLAIGLWSIRRPLFAGISAGLALLAGPALLQGAIGLVLAWAVWRLLVARGVLDPLEVELGSERISADNGKLWVAAYAAAGTILLAGTLFLFYPAGLGGLAAALPAYLGGWLQPSGVPASRLLAALVIYQPFALVFGILAGIRAWRRADSIPCWLTLWFAAALLLAIWYPGRQAADLVWAILPLWVLAAMEIGRHFHIYEWDRLPASGQALLIVILLALAWINLAGVSLISADPEVAQLRWAVIAGSLALGGVSTALVALGWSPVVAQRGLAWGFGVAMGLYVLATLWGATQLRLNGERELWRPAPAIHQADLLLETLRDLSIWRTGHSNRMDVVVATPAPSLRWLLRDWQEASFITSLAPSELPEAIIATVDQSQPQLAVSYRGQDFSWWVSPGWEGAIPVDWPRWLVFREAPQVKEHVILWARGDVFPEGSLLPALQEGPPGLESPAEDDQFVPGEGP